MSNLETAVEKLREIEAKQRKYLIHSDATQSLEYKNAVYYYLDGIKRAVQEMEYQLKVEKGTNLW